MEYEKSMLFVLDYTGIFGSKSELRPKEEIVDLLDFLKFYGEVGIYSSTMYKNIISGLKRYNIQHYFSFIFDRSHTFLDPDYQLEESIENYDTVKSLTVIIDNPIANPLRVYDISNTIMCDDTPSKVRRIPEDNVLILPTWTGVNNIAELKKMILNKMTKLKTRWLIH